LTASGLPTEEIHFVGFLPQKSAQRKRRLEGLNTLEATLVFYESPYRVEKLLAELAEVLPERRVVLARELTKKFEEYLRGTPVELAEVYKKRNAKGEFVVMVEGKNANNQKPNTKDQVGTEGVEVGNEDGLSEHSADEGSNDGREQIYERPIATVGALIFDDGGKVLMLRTHKWSGLWGIPGGKPKFGEASEEALRREVKEETNLEIGEIEFVLVQDCIHSTEFYRDAHFVLLNYRCKALGPTEVKLNDEAEEFRWVTMDEAFELPLNVPTRVLLEAVMQRRS
jgi:ADP-ribose pyrophosphatase YjhB (NUDIX family)